MKNYLFTLIFSNYYLFIVYSTHDKNKGKSYSRLLDSRRLKKRFLGKKVALLVLYLFKLYLFIYIEDFYRYRKLFSFFISVLQSNRLQICFFLRVSDAFVLYILIFTFDTRIWIKSLKLDCLEHFYFS